MTEPTAKIHRVTDTWYYAEIKGMEHIKFYAKTRYEAARKALAYFNQQGVE